MPSLAAAVTSQSGFNQYLILTTDHTWRPSVSRVDGDELPETCRPGSAVPADDRRSGVFQLIVLVLVSGSRRMMNIIDSSHIQLVNNRSIGSGFKTKPKCFPTC